MKCAALSLSQAYWPFHKTYCKRNEFADSVEEREPRFARWLRKHGKQAQLKDDEVDRIERASKAACGPSRQEVMDSMYNRLNPKPKGTARSHSVVNSPVPGELFRRRRCANLAVADSWAM